MARLNGSHSQLLRIKSGIGADADYTDVTVPIPGYAGAAGNLENDDPAQALAWSIAPRRSGGEPLHKVKIKVTFRIAANGAEVSGSYNATVFAINKPEQAEGNAGLRPAVESLATVVAQPSGRPMIVDVARCDAMGVIFTSITAVGADQVFIYVQEWA